MATEETTKSGASGRGSALHDSLVSYPDPLQPSLVWERAMTTFSTNMNFKLMHSWWMAREIHTIVITNVWFISLKVANNNLDFALT